MAFFTMDSCMHMQFNGLWKHNDFLKLWAGETVSLFGSQITVLALPLVAANTLQASPFEMGTLGFAQYIPWLLIGMFAGVWVDRLRRRPLMIAADLGRAILLALIPLTAILGGLQMWHLFVIGFLVGIGNVFFEIAYYAYLPALVGREGLVEGNSKLTASASASEVVGPGLGGILTQAITAPLAILFDALSFFASAGALIHIRKPEPLPSSSSSKNKTFSVWRDAWDGLRLVTRHRLLRGFVGCSLTGNVAIDVHLAVYILYLTRELGVQAGTLGLIYALGGAGGVLGALLVRRLNGRFGMGHTIVISQLFHGICLTALPLAALLGGTWAIVSIAGVHFVWGLTATIYSVPAVSLRQAITPDHWQGRIAASMRVLTFGVSPLGFLIGGWLGEWIGLWPTLLLAGLGLLLSNLWLSLSPLPGVHSAETLPRELLVAEA
jgi:MFS family permease